MSRPCTPLDTAQFIRDSLQAQADSAAFLTNFRSGANDLFDPAETFVRIPYGQVERIVGNVALGDGQCHGYQLHYALDPTASNRPTMLFRAVVMTETSAADSVKFRLEQTGPFKKWVSGHWEDVDDTASYFRPYRDNVFRRQPDGTYRPVVIDYATPDRSDAGSVFFTRTEIDALIDANKIAPSRALKEIDFRWVAIQFNSSYRHSVVMYPVYSDEESTRTGALKGKLADLGHLCPPNCTSVTYLRAR